MTRGRSLRDNLGAVPAQRYRTLLVVLVALGLGGTAGELILLEHTEGRAQLAPLVAVAVGVAACVGFAARPGRGSVAMLRLSMLGLIGVAGFGLYYHFVGNLEFERELHPTARGWGLIWDTLGGATPALAPGVLALLGLIGLLASSLPSESE